MLGQIWGPSGRLHLTGPSAPAQSEQRRLFRPAGQPAINHHKETAWPQTISFGQLNLERSHLSQSRNNSILKPDIEDKMGLSAEPTKFSPNRQRPPEYRKSFFTFPEPNSAPPALIKSIQANQSTVKTMKTTQPVKFHHHQKQDQHQTSLQLEGALRQQRTLLSLFQGYMFVVISLLLIYALYYICLHLPAIESRSYAIGSNQIPPAEPKAAQYVQSNANNPELVEKLQLLQRYVELIALDLEETKNRLREREKCHCSQGCSFNGTNFADGSKWQNQCDTCNCQAGKISCSPIKCPVSKCDDPVQVPGQCCPVCMKSCKYNQTFVKHNHSFKPSESSNKQCKCLDGLIKCQPLVQLQPQLKPNSTLSQRRKSNSALAAPANNFRLAQNATTESKPPVNG